MEIKGGRKWKDDNYMNILETTNHTITYKIEDGDAQVLSLKVSNWYAKSFEYFKRLEESLNENTGGHFISFWKSEFCCGCIESNEKKMSNTAFEKIVDTKYEKK